MSRIFNKTNVPSEDAPAQRPTSPIASSLVSPRSQQTMVPMRFGPAVAVSGAVEIIDKTKGGARSYRRAPDRNSKNSKDTSIIPDSGGTSNTTSATTVGSTALPGDVSSALPPSPTLTLSTLPADHYPRDDASATTAGSSYLPSPGTESTILPDDFERTGASRGPSYSTQTPPPPRSNSTGRTPSPMNRFTTPGFSTPEESSTPVAERFSETGTITEAEPAASVRSMMSTPRTERSGMYFEEISASVFEGYGSSVAETEETVQYQAYFQETMLSAESTYARQRRSLLDILNRLHSTGVQQDIDLPQVVVIGSQSVGKSSLIESMSGVTLPRDTGTCTRCPLECRLEYSTEKWSCRVFLRFEHDTLDNSLEHVKEVDFGPIITDKAEVEGRLRRAQRAILRPTLEPDLFLQDRDLTVKDPPALSFSSNCVCMRIIGPDVPDLYFFDLPGVIANVRDGGDVKDIELVRNLALKYISRPSCIILLVVSCETDFENQGAGRLAFEVDPDGDRIVGVLTKPDRIEHATGDKWASILRNEDNHLVNGWFCVKQPDPTELKQKMGWDEARGKEEFFFSHYEPWRSMPIQFRRRLGSMNLIRFLSRLLSKLIAIRLPDVERELAIASEDINARLRELPPSKYNDPCSEMFNLIFDFSSAVSKEVRGSTRFDPNSTGLIQGIRFAQRKLKSSVLRTAPRFCPWERNDTPPGSPSSILSNTVGSSTGAPHAWVSEPLFLSREEYIGFEDRNGRIMFLDEVMEYIQKAITRELPGDYPTFVVKEELIKSCLKGWGRPMLEYFEAVNSLMNAHMKRLVNIHFGVHIHSGLHAKVMSIVREQLRLLREKTLQHLTSILSVEGLPFTLNHMYLKEYKDRFLAHYKDIRRRSNGQDAIMRKFQGSEGAVVSTQLRNDIVDITALLERLGLPCTPADLHRLLPDDELESALDIIASVRAYFQVAFRRFIDLVPLTIDAEFIMAFEITIRPALITGLDVRSTDRCSLWLQDAPEVLSRRKELQATKQRLEAARVELSSFALP